MEIPKERECTKCGEVKPLTSEHFYPQPAYKYGLTRWCRACRSKNATKINKEERDQYRAEWAQDDRSSKIDKYRLREFAREMKKYGSTIDGYRDKLVEQDGVCALCRHLSYHRGKLQRLQVDHNHDCCDLKTKSCGKCLRGLLCADCNIKLSYFERFLSNAESAIFKPGTWENQAVGYINNYKMRKAVAAVEKDIAQVGRDMAEGKIPDMHTRVTKAFAGLKERRPSFAAAFYASVKRNNSLLSKLSRFDKETQRCSTS